MFDPTAHRRPGPGRSGKRLAAGEIPSPVTPPDGVALTDPSARAVFRRDAVRRLRIAVYTIALLVSSVVLFVVGGTRCTVLGIVAAVLGTGCAIGTAAAWGTVRDLYAVGAAERWVPYTVVLIEGAAFLRDADGGQRVLVTGRVPEWPRWQELPMWLAGDPESGVAILTPTGGGELAWIPPQSATRRRQMLAELIRRGLGAERWPSYLRISTPTRPLPTLYARERELATLFDLVALYDHGVTSGR